MFALIPMMHAGIKSGEVEKPDLWMTFVGILMGHKVFGIVIDLIITLC